LPSVLPEGLIAKYQRNVKLKKVSRLALPICGDKGKIVKWDGEFIRVPALLKKEGIKAFGEYPNRPKNQPQIRKIINKSNSLDRRSSQ
jgi:hypothetical protein